MKLRQLSCCCFLLIELDRLGAGGLRVGLVVGQISGLGIADWHETETGLCKAGALDGQLVGADSVGGQR